jgi:hypothetical protein
MRSGREDRPADRPCQRPGRRLAGARGWSRTIDVFLVGEVPGRRASRAKSGRVVPLESGAFAPTFTRRGITQQLRPAESIYFWYPRRESNPRFRIEKPANWTAVRQGRVFVSSTGRNRTCTVPVNSRAHCRYATVERGGLLQDRRNTDSHRPARSLPVESNHLTRLRGGRLPRRARGKSGPPRTRCANGGPGVLRESRAGAGHGCSGRRARAKSARIAGVPVSKPTTSIMPASSGSAMLNPFDTMPTTTSLAGMPDRSRYSRRAWAG